jgi:hypothetical protein
VTSIEVKLGYHPGQGKLKLNLDFTLVFKNFTSMDNQNGNSLISFGEFVRAMWAV